MINSFGDINVDLIWSNSPSTDSLDDSRDENLTIQVGGAAVNLARSAVAMGEEARFIGKVGNDPFGRFAIEELSKAGLPTHIVTDPSHPTGIIDLIPTSTLSPTETRLMLHNLPNANQYFAINDFPSANPWLSRDDILFVTGYSLFRDPVSHAARFLTSNAQECDAKVVFDLVPHRLESIGQARSLLTRIEDNLSKPLDLCIGEFRTWSYLFEQPSVTTPSHADLIEIGRRASAISRLTCIRYGFENCEMQSLVAGDPLLFDAPTTYRTLSPQQRVGFSELLTASLIQQIFLGRHSWIYASGESFTVPLSVLEGFLASTPRQARILDVGCGYGRLFTGLQSLGFQNLFGIDSSDSMVEAVRRQYHEIPVYHGSVDTLAEQGGEFDVCLLVAMLTTLQKDDDLQQLLHSLWRILRVGGRLLVCDFLINDDEHHRHQYSLYRQVFSEAAYGTFFSANGSVNRHRSMEEIQTTLGRLFNMESFSLVSLPTLTGKQSHGFVTVCTKSEEVRA